MLGVRRVAYRSRQLMVMAGRRIINGFDMDRMECHWHTAAGA